MPWLKVYSDPVLIFYAKQSDLDYVGDTYLSYPFLLDVGSIRNAVKLLGGQESTNTSATLDNSRLELTALFGVPPLKKMAVIYELDELLFTGIITRVSLELITKVAIEA